MFARRLSSNYLVPAITILFLWLSCDKGLDPLDSVPPPVPNLNLITITGPDSSGLVTLSGSAGAVEENASVEIRNLTSNDKILVIAADDGSFESIQIAAAIVDTLQIIALDENNNVSDPLLISLLPPDDVPPPDPDLSVIDISSPDPNGLVTISVDNRASEEGSTIEIVNMTVSDFTSTKVPEAGKTNRTFLFAAVGHTIGFTAVDLSRNRSGQTTADVMLRLPPSDFISVCPPDAGGNSAISGRPGTVQGRKTITVVVTNINSSEQIAVTARDDGGFFISLPAIIDDTITVVLRDREGNTSAALSFAVALDDTPPLTPNEALIFVTFAMFDPVAVEEFVLVSGNPSSVQENRFLNPCGTIFVDLVNEDTTPPDSVHIQANPDGSFPRTRLRGITGNMIKVTSIDLSGNVSQSIFEEVPPPPED